MFDCNGCCVHFCWSGQSSAIESDLDVCLNEAQAGKDQSCLRDEEGASLTCSESQRPALEKGLCTENAGQGHGHGERDSQREKQWPRWALVHRHWSKAVHVDCHYLTVNDS